MKRRHDMPYGASAAGDGARFRLWAPQADAVELVLDGQRRPMRRADHGFFELEAPARTGSRYGYAVDGGELVVPDPASRFNPDDVHGASELIDPAAYAWRDADWRGRPWREAVVYELHVGTFTPEGTFAGVASRLDHLVELGVTAIELMPVADFPGRRNWGYDGVLPYAPDASYGRPEDLKRLIDAAHERGLMVLLDVVYNHFGPEGNYLHLYAKDFFTERIHTPWGAAIDFGHRPVRDFFVHNALYWLEEYHVDGLRLDAVHAIHDDSAPDILVELAERVRLGPGRHRHVHLVLENLDNEAHYLCTGSAPASACYEAQWNDDYHHAAHVILTGETDGYYADFADDPVGCLVRCLTEGFAWQGEPSPYHDGEPRGEPSAHLPPSAFVNFLQNHDQVGNRAFGERLTELAPAARLRALRVLTLLAPSPPLLFMGEEFAARSRFAFFCDFGDELAEAVASGRRAEFARFPAFEDPEARQRIPHPNEEATFAAARLDWRELERPDAVAAFEDHKRLLELRQRELVPRLPVRDVAVTRLAARAFIVTWRLDDDARLSVFANLGDAPVACEPVAGRRLYTSAPTPEGRLTDESLPPWSSTWVLA